jgi:hypothetical protein
MKFFVTAARLNIRALAVKVTDLSLLCNFFNIYLTDIPREAGETLCAICVICLL